MLRGYSWSDIPLGAVATAALTPPRPDKHRGKKADQLMPVQAQSSPLPATFVAVAPAIAFADLTALFFVDAGAAQALAIAPTSVLRLLNEAFREAGVAHINADRCGDGVRDTCETQAGSQDHCTDDCLHVGSLPVNCFPSSGVRPFGAGIEPRNHVPIRADG